MLSVEALATAGDEIAAFLKGNGAAALSAFDIERYVGALLEDGSFSSADSFIHSTAKVHPTAIVSRSILLAGAEVHEFASIRNTIMFPSARVGHAGEIARSILGPGVSLPRFNYVGSSILGAGVRFGGCVSVATRRFDDGSVLLQSGSGHHSTGRTKFGAIVGEHTIVGFGVHINPGITIGRRCLISPLVDLRVSIEDDQIVLLGQNVHVRPRLGRFQS